MNELINMLVTNELNGDIVLRNNENLIIFTDVTDFSNALISLKADKVNKIDEEYRRGTEFEYQNYKIVYAMGGY